MTISELFEKNDMPFVTKEVLLAALCNTFPNNCVKQEKADNKSFDIVFMNLPDFGDWTKYCLGNRYFNLFHCREAKLDDITEEKL